MQKIIPVTIQAKNTAWIMELLRPIPDKGVFSLPGIGECKIYKATRTIVLQEKGLFFNGQLLARFVAGADVYGYTVVDGTDNE